MRKSNIFIWVIIAIGISGCGHADKGDENKTNRITVKDVIHTTSFNGSELRIIEVDGVEYLETSNGGIYPLIK